MGEQVKRRGKIRMMADSETRGSAAESRIKAQAEFLESVLESLPHPFYVINVADYSIRLANSAACKDFLPEKTTCYELTHQRAAPCTSDDHPCPLKIIKETKQPVMQEHVHYDREGRPRYVEVHGYPIFDEKGEVVQIIESVLDITDRKQMEQKLRESVRFNQRIADVLPLVLYIYDLRTRRNVYVNREVSQMIGYSPEQVLAMGEYFVPLVMHPEDIVRFAEHMQAMANLPEGTTLDFEYRMRSLEGDWRWLHSRDSVFERDESGLPIRILGAASDITERKRVEEALRESEKRLVEAQHIAKIGNFTLDIETGEVACSEALLDLLQCSRSEKIDSAWVNAEVIHPDDLHQVTRWWQDSIASGKSELPPNEYRMVSKDGKLLYVRTIGVIKRERGKPRRVFGTVQDITEYKLFEESLVRERNLTNRMIDSLPGIFYLFDQEGKFLRWSRNLVAVTGYSDQEIIRLHPVEMFRGSDRRLIAKQIEKVFKTGYAEIEAELVTRDGRAIPYYFTGSRIEFSGRPCLIGMGIDITERKRAEAELQNAHDELELRVERRTAELALSNKELKEYAAKLERLNKELEEFAFVASHDLREPLRKIQTFGSRLEEIQNTCSKEARDAVTRMIKSSRHMDALIKALQDYSVVTRGTETFEAGDLTTVAMEALADLEIAIEESGGRIEVQRLPAIKMDRAKIRQLFQNLIGNAIKFVREDEAPVVRITGEIAEGICRIYVADNGIGFEETYRERIFAPFQRLHGKGSPYEGTGMGLAICRKVVEMHGGEITARSTPGKGSTFIISLPAE